MFRQVVTFLIVALGGMVLTGCTSGPRSGGLPNPTLLPPPSPSAAGWNEGLELIPEPAIADKQVWPPVYFAYDQSLIGDTEKKKLDQMFECLTKNTNVHLLIEGHCDERGSEEYNRTLGERRALAIRRYLAALGIEEARLHTLSYGEERPAVAGKTEEAFRQNRRAELILIPAKGAASVGS